MKPAALRPLAGQDLVRQTRYYRNEAGDEVADRFFDAASSTLREVESMPGAGSLRFGEICGIPELRHRRIEGYPMAWFYLEHADRLDVVRLLHLAQDIPALLADDDQAS